MISTFHAFGDRVIRDHALELGLPSEPRVLSRPETVIFLQERLFRFDLDEYRPLGNPTRFLAALATLFSRLKDEDISPAAYAAHAALLVAEAEAEPDDRTREALRETARRQAELAAAYVRYQELLGEAGAIDFGDQVALALRLLREHPATRAELQRRFRYILVDEFQDVNRAQAELVALLAEPRRNLAVVGDDDQSIYRFRGAAIRRHRRLPASGTGAPGRSSCAATTARWPRSSTRRTGSSGSTTRTGWRCRPASPSA